MSKTINIDTTLEAEDLESGKIPVGVSGGDWLHITPAALVAAIMEKVGDNLGETITDSVTESVLASVKENITTEVGEAVSTAIDIEALKADVSAAVQTAVAESIESKVSQAVAEAVNVDAISEAVIADVAASFNETIDTIVEQQVKNLSMAAPVVEEVNTPTLVIKPEEIQTATTYVCGTLTSLTVESLPVSPYEITAVFASGSTPTELSLPAGYKSAGPVTVAKDKNYVISILNGIVVCKPLTTN